MREIKFRGKCSQSKRWVYGWLLTNKLGTYIVTEENPHECTQNHYIEIDEYCRVVPETVGQYTGFKDKNEKEIYEGDIIRHHGDILSEIFYNSSHCAYLLKDVSGNRNKCICDKLGDYSSLWIEVIGNIHDNPELLGGAE